MKVGEVCLFTKDVVRLSNFYKSIFDIDNGSNDNIHQFIISEETTLSVYNDGVEREMNAQNICIAFTVDDVDFQYERLTTLGVKILEPPTIRPWGAKNMSFLDPDNNLIVFRSFLEKEYGNVSNSPSLPPKKGGADKMGDPVGYMKKSLI